MLMGRDLQCFSEVLIATVISASPSPLSLVAFIVQNLPFPLNLPFSPEGRRKG
jgi:hypothetical protein